METNVTFRHFNSPQPQLQEKAIELANRLTHYADEILSANVEFINEQNKIVEFTVHVNGEILKARSESEDFHKSLNDASDKMQRQIIKWKTKHFKI
ncbi:MAG TPA: ribosome-associated translation inhibitor RaiA [Candidatus Kapabacteria bacterium]|jgi:ribosomal subunit interface protein|nr:ribosome-associated translation inhibitor RaiA [Candidatus Kapabacteria bacterium]HOV92588.1 ribosome-associated translation inhibitor RaiA [Candidatus Kapabacteria bacterium]